MVPSAEFWVRELVSPLLATAAPTRVKACVFWVRVYSALLLFSGAATRKASGRGCAPARAHEALIDAGWSRGGQKSVGEP